MSKSRIIFTFSDAALTHLTTRCCSWKMSSTSLHKSAEKSRARTDRQKEMNDVKHFHYQWRVVLIQCERWLPKLQTLHHLHKMFLIIKTVFFCLLQESQWIQCDCDLEMIFFLSQKALHINSNSLKSSRTPSIVPACSVSECPSLRLFTCSAF